MSGVARARYSFDLSRSLTSATLAAAVALGLLSCKDDPVRRRLSDAGLSLSPDAGADGGLAGGRGSAGTVPGSELIPGLGDLGIDGDLGGDLGIDPDLLDPGLLPPGFADAGLFPPDLDPGIGSPPGVPPSGVAGVVGRPCAANADCGPAPLVCILSSSDTAFQSGGPQGGYCSLPCTGTAQCTAVDDLAGCNTAFGFCVGLCTPGAGGLKCGLERPLACLPLAQATSGVCLPTCTSDDSCGPGRFCDLGASGLCQDAPAAGGAVGASCTRATEVDDCAGDICLRFLDPSDGATTVGSFCSANCTFGRVDGCGFDTLSSGTRSAACLQPQDADGAEGDLGFCFPLCDESSDCEQSADGWVCAPFADESLTATLGRAGRCLPIELTSEPGIPEIPDVPGIPELPGFPDLLSR